MNRQNVAEILHEFSLWKKESGRYASLGVVFPYSSAELTEALDEAVNMLQSYGYRLQEEVHRRVVYKCKHCGKVYPMVMNHRCNGEIRECETQDFDEINI